MQLQISCLLQKPTDLDLHCFLIQGKRRVKKILSFLMQKKKKKKKCLRYIFTSNMNITVLVGENASCIAPYKTFFHPKNVDIFHISTWKTYDVMLIRNALVRHFQCIPTTCFHGESRERFMGITPVYVWSYAYSEAFLKMYI